MFISSLFYKRIFIYTLVFVVFIAIFPSFVWAQDISPPNVTDILADSATENDDVSVTETKKFDILRAVDNRRRLQKPDVELVSVGSVLYTPYEHSLLQEAKRGAKSGAAGNLDVTERGERPQGPREVSLGGLVYRNKTDWTAWLNGQRINAEALPVEIIDISAGKDYLDIKWFDAYSNLVYPIRLRPHERFNLDSRIFLPGARTGAF